MTHSHSRSHSHSHAQPENTADSAGFPWAGRSFDQHDSTFADDHGELPEELGAVLSAFRAGEASIPEVLAVFDRSRLLIPLLTVAGDVGETPDGRIVDKTQELSIVTVKAPDGRSVLPVFSSVAAMRRWNPSARPIPNIGRQVVQAVLDDGNDLVILDPGSAETEFGIRRPALWALAEQRAYVCPWDDPEVREAFERTVHDEPAVTGVALATGDPEARLLHPELAITLSLESGLTQDALNALLERVQQRWSASDSIAERVDSLSLRLVSAS